MSQDTAWLPCEIADQLTELKSWVRWQWLLRGTGRVGMIASLGLAGAFAADYRYDLAPTTRIAVLSSVVAVTLIAFLAWIVVPLCRRIGWAELAAMADKANPRWEGALTSAVELFDPTQPDGFKGSPVMREMLLKQTRQRVDELDLEEVVSSRKAWSSVRWGLVSCFMLAIPVFVAPSMYRQLWQRFLMPWGNWGTAGAWTVVVENGDRIVARGTDVELLATAEKAGQVEPPKSLTLEWRDSAGTTDRRAMPFDEARKSFVAVVPHVMRDLDFRIAVERQKSRDYKIQVVEPPVVTKIRLDVEPPAYAGWPAQSLDGAIGSIKVFEKSRLKFTLEFNKPVETAQLVWRQHGDANKKLELAKSKQTATLEVTADPAVAGPFLFALEDIHKLPNNDTVPRELVVVTDEAPKLTVKGDHSTEARPNDVVPIDVTASDDVGLGTMELHLTIENNPREPITIEAVRGQKNFEHRFTLDLSQLNVEHNQWLNYRVRITDERPEPGPHEVWSEPRVLRISKKAAPPGANELAKSHEQLRDELNSLRRDIDAKANEIQDLRKEAAQPDRKKDAPADAERVAQLQKQLHQLTERAEQLAKQLSQDPLFHELGEKAEQIAQNELKQAEAQIQESRGEAKQPLNPEQLGHLNQAEKQLHNAATQLSQLEKPFEQLADLQKDLLELRRLSRQAEQLANRADQLAKNDDNARRGSPDPAANQPEASARDEKQPDASARDDKQAAAEAAKTEQEKQQLVDQQKQLADALNDLLKRRPELLAAAQRDQLDQLSELAKEASELAEQQKELADALREKQAAAAERNTELAEKQQDLQKRVEAQVDRSLGAPKPDEPKTDKPATPDGLQEAVASLKQGDLAEAQKQQQQAVNELERLAAELKQAKANQSPLAKAARDLASDQKKLADKAADAQKSDDAEQRQKAAEQLKREQAALNERIDNLPADNKAADAPKDPNAKPNPVQAAREQAAAKAEQAEQALADGDLAKAAQEQRRAEEALRDLAKQAAAQPMPEAQANRGDEPPMPNGDAQQDKAKPNEAKSDPAAQQLAQLAEEQRQLAKEVAQALKEQNGEQQQPKADQPPAANEQANAKNANEQPMPANAQQPAGENAKPNQPQNPGDQPKPGQPMNPMPPNAGEQPNAPAPQKQEQANAAQPNSEKPQGDSGEKPQAQPGGQKSEPQVAQQVRETQQAQKELAQQAQQLQKQVEQELGKDSAEAKQSQQTARLCES